MKLQIKKIIAREFLVLVITFSIGVLAFLLTFPYNQYRQYQASKFEKQIIETITLVDSLSKSFENKTKQQKWWFEILNNEFDLGAYNSIDKLWERQFELAIKDSIRIIWDKNKIATEFLHKIGFNCSDSLQVFIKANKINNFDIENKKKADKIRVEIPSLKSKKNTIEKTIFIYSQQINFGKSTLIILLVLLFGFRYVFYAVAWSIKTLKQN